MNELYDRFAGAAIYKMSACAGVLAAENTFATDVRKDGTRQTGMCVKCDNGDGR